MLVSCHTFYFVSYMQQDLQSKDLQIETPCDEPTQGKIVTLLWYLECVMDHVCKGFFHLFMPHSVNIIEIDLPPKKPDSLKSHISFI